MSADPSSPSPVDVESPEVGDLFDELPFWSAPFAMRILEEIPMTPGLVWLDVGAGTGFLTMELAQRLGPETRVIAVDPWAAAVARLRRKVAHVGLSNVTIVERAIEDADLEPASVDVAVSNLGVNNFSDCGAALAAIARALKPGGEFHATTNIVGHMAEFYAAFRRTLIREGQHGCLQALQDHVQHRGTAASWDELLSRAGFETRRVRTDEFTMRLANGKAFLSHYFVRLGFLPAWEDIVDPSHRERVFSALERDLDDSAARSGELSLTVPVLSIEARRAR